MSTRQITSDKPKPSPRPWRRHALGAITVLFLAGGLCFSIMELGGQELNGWQRDLHSACFRIGLICAAGWLAYDQVRRIPVWIWPILVLLLLVVAWRPRWLVFLVPLLLLVALLRPRKPRTRGRA